MLRLMALNYKMNEYFTLNFSVSSYPEVIGIESLNSGCEGYILIPSDYRGLT